MYSRTLETEGSKGTVMTYFILILLKNFFIRNETVILKILTNLAQDYIKK